MVFRDFRAPESSSRVKQLHVKPTVLLTYFDLLLRRHRQVRAFKQPCDTTPPPRPVPRQLVCYIIFIFYSVIIIII